MVRGSVTVSGEGGLVYVSCVLSILLENIPRDIQIEDFARTPKKYFKSIHVGIVYVCHDFTRQVTGGLNSMLEFWIPENLNEGHLE